MKLNLGCGFDKRDGWVNADSFAGCDPDVLMDIETVPWPFADGQFDHILLKHVLEHVGETRQAFFDIIKELYRVCANGCRVEIHVPHYLHETYYSDPTHIRAITFTTMQMLSKKINLEWAGKKQNATMLALMLDVDFDLVDGTMNYDDYWWGKVVSGDLTIDDLRELNKTHAGIVRELKFVLTAVK